MHLYKIEYYLFYYSPFRRIKRSIAIAKARWSSEGLIRSYEDNRMMHEIKFEHVEVDLPWPRHDVGISREIYISPMPDDNETVSKLFRLQGLWKMMHR